VKKLF